MSYMNTFPWSLQRPLSGKIRVISCHPSLHICACSDGEVVVVWDFVENRKAHGCKLPYAVSKDTLDIFDDRQSSNNVSSFGANPGKDSDLVRHLDFIDYETLQFAGYNESSLSMQELQRGDSGVNGKVGTSFDFDDENDGININAKDTIPTIKGRRYLSITRENKIQLVDMVSGKHMDASSKSMFDGKSPNVVQGAVIDSTVALLVGCSDGGIRVIRLDRWNMAETVGGNKDSVSSMTGAHRNAITNILPLHPNTSLRHSRPKIISTSADGTIAVWEESLPPKPTKVIKAHDGGVESIVAVVHKACQGRNYNYLLASAGTSDKTIALWNTFTWTEVSRLKPFVKVPVTVMTTLVLPHFGGVGSDILFSSYSATTPALALLCRSSNTVKGIFDLSCIASTTKRVKVYSLQSMHSSRDWVLVGTNYGLVVSKLECKEVSLPPSTHVSCDKQSFAASVSDEGIFLTPLDRRKQAQLVVAFTTQSAKGPPQIFSASSAKGTSLFAVVWPQIREYKVYTMTSPSEVQEIDSGNAVNLAFSSMLTNDEGKKRVLFALVHCPPLPQQADGIQKGKGLFRRKSKKGIAKPSDETLKEGTLLKIKEILLQDNKYSLIRDVDKMEVENLHCIHGGGPALAPVVGSDSKNRRMRLLRWSDLTSLCNEDDISVPRWLVWNSSDTYLALGYDSFVAVLSSHPYLQLKGVVPIKNSSSGIWHEKVLCISNPDSIIIATINADVVQVRTLATSLGTPASVHNTSLISLKEKKRPPGHLKLLTVHKGHLWMVDGCLRIFAMLLDPHDEILH